MILLVPISPLDQAVSPAGRRDPSPLALLRFLRGLSQRVVKDREARGRYAIGAQHKLAGVDVAYSLEVLDPFGRGRDGKVKVVVKKDRPGHVRGYADDDVAAIVGLTSGPDDTVGVSLVPPGRQEVAEDLTAVMERVSRALEKQPGLTSSGLRTAVGGRGKSVDRASQLLIERRNVEVREQGQAHQHFVLKPYRRSQDQVPVSRPGPDRVPDPPRATVSPCPTPLRGDTVTDPVPKAAGCANRVHHLVSPFDRDADIEARAERLLAYLERDNHRAKECLPT
jgi:hypothetical protein